MGNRRYFDNTSGGDQHGNGHVSTAKIVQEMTQELERRKVMIEQLAMQVNELRSSLSGRDSQPGINVVRFVQMRDPLALAIEMQARYPQMSPAECLDLGQKFFDELLKRGQSNQVSADSTGTAGTETEKRRMMMPGPEFNPRDDEPVDREEYEAWSDGQYYCKHCGNRIYMDKTRPSFPVWRHHGSNFEKCFAGLESSAEPVTPEPVIPEPQARYQIAVKHPHGWRWAYYCNSDLILNWRTESEAITAVHNGFRIGSECRIVPSNAAGEFVLPNDEPKADIPECLASGEDLIDYENEMRDKAAQRVQIGWRMVAPSGVADPPGIALDQPEPVYRETSNPDDRIRELEAALAELRTLRSDNARLQSREVKWKRLAELLELHPDRTFIGMTDEIIALQKELLP